jgi:hypothetical protein
MTLGAETTFAPDEHSLYWASMNAYDQVGLKPVTPPPERMYDTGAGPGIARSTGPGAMSLGTIVDAPWSPHSPLFWFGALLAGTLGLVALSTEFNVRVGPARANVGGSLGKKK